jgi:hypothetical protein
MKDPAGCHRERGGDQALWSSSSWLHAIEHAFGKTSGLLMDPNLPILLVPLVVVPLQNRSI